MSDTDKSDAINRIVSLLGSKKNEVGEDIRTSINHYISNSSRSDCLTMVLRNGNGAITETIPPAADARYATTLINFVRHKPINGFTIDSYLTDPCSNLTADIFSRHVEEHSGEVSIIVAKYIVNTDAFITALSTAVEASLQGSIPDHLKRTVTRIVIAKIKYAVANHVDAAQATALRTAIAKGVGASVSTPVAAKVAAVLIHSLALTIKPIIIKLIATGALKAIIFTKLRSIIIGSILGAFVKLIGVKLGLTTMGAFMFVLIPVVLAWLAYEAVNFNKKLASEVSHKVSDDIVGNFDATNKSIAESLVKQAVAMATTSIASSIITDPSINDMILESSAEAS